MVIEKDTIYKYQQAVRDAELKYVQASAKYGAMDKKLNGIAQIMSQFLDRQNSSKEQKWDYNWDK